MVGSVSNGNDAALFFEIIVVSNEVVMMMLGMLFESSQPVQERAPVGIGQPVNAAADEEEALCRSERFHDRPSVRVVLHRFVIAYAEDDRLG